MSATPAAASGQQGSTPNKGGRAGRNLPVAVGVALVLGGLCLAALTLVDWGWLLLATPAMLLAVWELNGGMAAGKIHIPLVPVWLGTAAMLPAAYLGGPAALIVAFGITILGVVCWRACLGLDGRPETSAAARSSSPTPPSSPRSPRSCSPSRTAPDGSSCSSS